MGKRVRFLKSTPSSFRNALKKLNSVRSHHKQCQMLRNSSDKFLRDFALATHRCIPTIEPLISRKALREIKRFASPNISMQSRRRMVEQKGGSFLSFLKNLGRSIWHTLRSITSTF